MCMCLSEYLPCTRRCTENRRVYVPLSVFRVHGGAQRADMCMFL